MSRAAKNRDSGALAQLLKVELRMKFFTFAVFQVFASSAQAQMDGTMTLDMKDSGGGGHAIAVTARAGAWLSKGGR